MPSLGQSLTVLSAPSGGIFIYIIITMKSIIFCRVSSKEQEETGYSLPAQEKLLKSYTFNKGYKITKVFSISESASGKAQRATFIQMIKHVNRENINIIVCEKVDRLTRNFKDAVMIDEWLEKNEARQVHLVKDSLILHKNSRSQEKLNWGIRILFAKNYIDNLSEEVKKGQKEKIQQGWLPTKAPVGYKTIGEKGHKTHIIDEEKAPLVQKMFDLYASGTYSITKLTTSMKQAGLTGYTGNPIVRSRIAVLLQDPFYIGQMRWNDITYQAKHTSLIAKNVFEKVQNTLHGKTTPKYSKHSYLFKGLFHCDECKGTITWEIQKGNIYGHCNHYKECKQTVWVKEPNVEKQLLPVFDTLVVKNKRIQEWIRKALKDSAYDEMEYTETSINELSKQEIMLNKRLKKMYIDLLDEKITQDFYDNLKSQIEGDLFDITEKLGAHNKANVKNMDMGVNIYLLSQNAGTTYQSCLLDPKRSLLKLVFDRLYLNEGTVSYELKKQFKLIQKLAQITESSKDKLETEEAKEIFEPTNNVDIKTQKEYLRLHCPNLLARMDDFRTLDWDGRVEYPQIYYETCDKFLTG